MPPDRSTRHSPWSRWPSASASSASSGSSPAPKAKQLKKSVERIASKSLRLPSLAARSSGGKDDNHQGSASVCTEVRQTAAAALGVAPHKETVACAQLEDVQVLELAIIRDISLSTGAAPSATSRPISTVSPRALRGPRSAGWGWQGPGGSRPLLNRLTAGLQPDIGWQMHSTCPPCLSHA